MISTKNKKIYSAWAIVFLLACVLLSLVPFRSSSNDSNYYSDLVVRYHDQNWQTVLTPKWGENYWGFDPNTYMRDQLPGQTIAGIAFTKIGIPAKCALYVAELLFQILSLILFVKIAGTFIGDEDSSALYYLLLLTPLAFSYNLRANHEVGIMFFSLLALYAGLKLGEGIKYLFFIVLSCFGLLWIKGPFCLFAFVMTVIGFTFSRKKNFVLLVVSLIAAALFSAFSAYLYEKTFQQITHESFFEVFWKIQIQGRNAMDNSVQKGFIIQKLSNFWYYFSHYLGYSVPWCLLFIILLIKNFKNKVAIEFLKSPLSLCLLSAAMSYCVIFSMSNRIAGRYVFPGYYMMCAWFILFAYNSSPLLQKVNQKISTVGTHLIAPGLWFLALALHFISP